MLILTAQFDLHSEHVTDGVALAQQLARESAFAPGCMHYAFAMDVIHPNRLHLIEYWTSEDYLASHLDTTAIERFRQQFSSLCINEAIFRLHQAVDIVESSSSEATKIYGSRHQ